MDASTRCPPLFKRIVVNDADAFFGFSPIQRRIDQEEQDLCDLTGKDAVMLRWVQAVLLDFDRPICAVFAGYLPHEVVAEIMKRAAKAGYALRPDDPDDPISVHKATTGMDPDVIAVVEDALVEEESTALMVTITRRCPAVPS